MAHTLPCPRARRKKTVLPSTPAARTRRSSSGTFFRYLEKGFYPYLFPYEIGGDGGDEGWDQIYIQKPLIQCRGNNREFMKSAEEEGKKGS